MDETYRISAKALILNETRDKFLIVLEESGKWDFAGGGLKFGESVEDCLRREIEEEMGVPVLSVAANPSYFLRGQFENPVRRGQWYANVFYEVKVGHLKFRPSNECGAILFVDAAEAKALQAFDSVYEFAKLFQPRPASPP
jgi:8-oxo-dGTP pyrophosphatase MutT (NUDIX family)